MVEGWGEVGAHVGERAGGFALGGRARGMPQRVAKCADSFIPWGEEV